MIVKTTGQMWQWNFEYPNGKISQDLILPLNEPVKLELISTDVIHGLSIPAFRVKEDVVPGKPNYAWFIPQEIGDFDIFCSAYCGVRHSYMHSYVKVVTKAEYEKILAELPDKPKEGEGDGLKILQNNACIGCHSLDGTVIVGPSFKGLYGSSVVVITDGTERTLTVDDEFMKSSIYDPSKDIAKGFNAGLMKSYQGIIKEEEIAKINEYLKTLK
jgi:cytochrome c oxidase subunit 2